MANVGPQSLSLSEARAAPTDSHQEPGVDQRREMAKKTFFKLAKEIHRKTYTINCKWRDLEYSSRNLTFMEKDIKPG